MMRPLNKHRELSYSNRPSRNNVQYEKPLIHPPVWFLDLLFHPSVKPRLRSAELELAANYFLANHADLDRLNITKISQRLSAGLK